MNKAQNMNIAKETIQINRVGFYIAENNNVVNIKDQIESAAAKSILYKPEFDIIGAELGKRPKNVNYDTTIEVTNETTLYAAKRLKEEGYGKICALVFGSAKDPGGDFEKGMDSQEAKICRASSLYPCISQYNEMYRANIRLNNGIYSNHIIFSQKVPVFRVDDELIDRPIFVSMITAPAVNAIQVRDENKVEAAQEMIDEAMVNRIRRILSIALCNKQEAIVLGAFGVRFQGNKAEDVAEYFRTILKEDENYKRAFKKVIFAVNDETTTKDVLRTFKEKLGTDR